MISARYKDNLLVIGNDLRNEIRNDYNNNLFSTWGSGDFDTDWKLAATNGGNLVLKHNPNMLIFVEGMSYANDMSPIKNSPI